MSDQPDEELVNMTEQAREDQARLFTTADAWLASLQLNPETMTTAELSGELRTSVGGHRLAQLCEAARMREEATGLRIIPVEGPMNVNRYKTMTKRELAEAVRATKHSRLPSASARKVMHLLRALRRRPSVPGSCETPAPFKPALWSAGA